MYVENSRSGIMKRSGMDVDIISDVQTLPIYSVSTVLILDTIRYDTIRYEDVDCLKTDE